MSKKAAAAAAKPPERKVVQDKDIHAQYAQKAASESAGSGDAGSGSASSASAQKDRQKTQHRRYGGLLGRMGNFFGALRPTPSGRPFYDVFGAADLYQNKKYATLKPEEVFYLRTMVPWDQVSKPPDEIIRDWEELGIRSCQFCLDWMYTQAISAGKYGYVGAFIPSRRVVQDLPAVAAKFQEVQRPDWSNPQNIIRVDARNIVPLEDPNLSLREELIVHVALMSMLDVPADQSVVSVPAPFVKLYDWTRCQLQLLEALDQMRPPWPAAKALKDKKLEAEYKQAREDLVTETLTILILKDHDEETRGVIMEQLRFVDPVWGMAPSSVNFDRGSDLPNNISERNWIRAAQMAFPELHNNRWLSVNATTSVETIESQPPYYQLHVCELVDYDFIGYFNRGGWDSLFTNDEFFFGLMSHVLFPLHWLGQFTHLTHGDLHLKNVLMKNVRVAPRGASLGAQQKIYEEQTRTFLMFEMPPDTRASSATAAAASAASSSSSEESVRRFYIPLSHTNGVRCVLNDFGFSHIQIGGTIQTPGHGEHYYRDLVKADDGSRQLLAGATTGYNPSYDMHQLGLALLTQLFGNISLGYYANTDPPEPVPEYGLIPASISVLRCIQDMLYTNQENYQLEAEQRYGVAYRQAYDRVRAFLSAAIQDISVHGSARLGVNTLASVTSLERLEKDTDKILWHKPLAYRPAMNSPSAERILVTHILPRYASFGPGSAKNSIIIPLKLRRQPDYDRYPMLLQPSSIMTWTAEDPLGYANFPDRQFGPGHHVILGRVRNWYRAKTQQQERLQRLRGTSRWEGQPEEGGDASDPDRVI